jgi:beta-glucanase (GH16 family)
MFKHKEILFISLLAFLILTIIPNISNIKADASQFTEIWRDDFNAEEILTDNWVLIDQGGGFGNNEKQYYTPNNASIVTVDGRSCLAIVAKYEQLPGKTEKYTSAKLITQGKHDFTYGRSEERV